VTREIPKHALGNEKGPPGTNCGTGKKKLERMERNSRDFNIRVLGVVEEEGEDCLSIIQDYFELLGLRDAGGEVENAHRTGKKRDGKRRHIIAKLYSRLFKRLNEICFKSPKARKVKMHSTELDSWKILLSMILRQGRKLSRL